MKKLNANDPRLTAYALGELEKSEQEMVEREMMDSPELRQEVAELRRFTSVLSQELAKEPIPEVTAATPKTRKSSTKTVWRLGFSLVPIAAGLLVFLNVKPHLGNIPTTMVKPEAPKAEEYEPYASTATGPEDEAADAPVAPPQRSAPTSAKKSPSKKFDLGAGSAGLARFKGDDMALESSRRANTKAKVKAREDFNTEGYSNIVDNEFISVAQDARSTFSVDVDTASYANVRRYITQGSLPPKDAVRIEELVNYFTYSYEAPKASDPFSINAEVSEAPWNKDHRLVRIALKGKEIPWEKRPTSNLVFLIDTSGSMEDANKLPLVRESMKLLVDKIGANDRVSIVVYAGSAGLVLPPTKGSEKTKILEALDKLQAGGSTNGGQGIELAYKTAQSSFVKGGANRVIIATDGDFNVGASSEGDLVRLIEEKRKSGIHLSVLGYGMGNYKDNHLEKLADKGNGNYAYIDTLNEAKKVMVKEVGGTLFTIAKDVKLQLEFNPAQVNAYRLIGYENRVLAHQDFNDDTKDAGDIGSGHTVTALYEVVPKGKTLNIPGVDPLKYQIDGKLSDKAAGGELLTLKLRYKKPAEDTSSLMTYAVVDGKQALGSASTDFKWAASVASFGMILRDSKFKGTSTYQGVIDLASNNKGADTEGYRSEFLDLVRKAQALPKKK